MSTHPTSFVPDNNNNNNMFDHIDHFLDFPEQNVFVGGRGDSFPTVWNASPFSCFDPEFTSELLAVDPEFTYLTRDANAPVWYDVQMEWFSAFAEDSSTDVSVTKPLVPIELHSSSPLESGSGSSSSSSSMSNGVKIIPLRADKNARSGHGYGRARSKRARPPTYTLQAFPAEQKKKRNGPDEMSNNETNPDLEVRKCVHCGITKTPQWRTGPMGPKTLCNACGVRHKSGRLFPEYRPAASPTFVPSLHSNSHKKVIEMRISSSVNVPATITPDDTTT